MESCFYEGVVHHERLTPVRHRFHYRLYLHYLDLQEVPALVRAGLLSESQFAPASFRRGDHFGDPRQPLADSVRELVQQQTGTILTGPIRLLTQMRNFGYYFSPLNLFFCHGDDGHTVEAIVAEVQNTPWLERHCYVLWRGNQEIAGAESRYRHAKSFHVSPFMNLDMEYCWRVTSPGEQLRVGIVNEREEVPLFRAFLNLHRIALSRRSRSTLLSRYPLMTARITAAIYCQAFHLWRKKCPSYPHPKCYAAPATPSTVSGPPESASWPVSSALG